MARHGCNSIARGPRPRVEAPGADVLQVLGRVRTKSGGSGVSKSTSTRWYIGAWVVALIALLIAFTTGHSATASTSVSPLTAVAWGVASIAGLVMLVAGIGAMIRLGQLHSWGWFAAVLILQLVGLGIIGMVAYAVAGTEEEMVVTRPTVSGG